MTGTALAEDALYYLGNVLLELERYDEALVAWQNLMEAEYQKVREFLLPLPSREGNLKMRMG